MTCLVCHVPSCREIAWSVNYLGTIPLKQTHTWLKKAVILQRFAIDMLYFGSQPCPFLQGEGSSSNCKECELYSHTVEESSDFAEVCNIHTHWLYVFWLFAMKVLEGEGRSSKEHELHGNGSYQVDSHMVENSHPSEVCWSFCVVFTCTAGRLEYLL